MTRRKSRRGTAVVEFALGSGIFVALFAGTFGFGHTFYTYNKLETAVRNGARYGALLVYESNATTTDSAPSSDFVTAVQNVTAFGDPNPPSGTAPVVSGLTASNVAVTVTFANGQPDTVRVHIRNYQVRSLFRNWTANRKPVASFGFMGRFAPL
jgi:Flp pilus assembly protein TadG